MAKTKKPSAPKSKPGDPTEVEVRYDLPSLPTAFHKAGLAGLVLLIESLKARKVLKDDEAQYTMTATEVTVTFTETVVQQLLNDVYDARLVEKRYPQPKKKENKPIPAKRIECEQFQEGGTSKDRKLYIYDEVEARGKFLNDNYPEMPPEASWLKLWREMIWAIPRPRDKNRIPYQERSRGETCNEAVKAWANLLKVASKRAKGAFHTSGISSALLPGAQDVNAEAVPFEGRAEENLLLHFWPLTALLYVPQEIERDGSTNLLPYSYTVAVPDVTDLSEFVIEYPKLLASLSTTVRGYRPAQAVVDLPAEGALALLEDLAVLTGLQIEQGTLRFSIGAVEYLHLVKMGNNVKLMAAGRVAPDRKVLVGYRAIVRPTGTAPQYRNSLFRRGLLLALLADESWYRPFGRTLVTFDHDVFIRQPRKDDEKGPPQFASDASKKFRHETALFTDSPERKENVPEALTKPAPAAVIVNRVVRGYLLARSQEKSGIKLDTFADAEKVDWSKVPGEFNEAKRKLAESLFLEFRSRRDQAFVDHFAATFFSVTQRLNEPDRLELADMLIADVRRDDLKTLTLLALAANS